MVKAPVFQPVVSPPRPACLRTNALTVWPLPRSTCRYRGAVLEQNWLLLARLQSTAFAGVSVVPHAVEPVAGRFRARFGPSAGGAGGWVAPSVKDGGTLPAPVPQLDSVVPIVYCRVPP